MSHLILDTAALKKFSDENLVNSFTLNGNRKAVFTEIVSRYKEKVYFLARRILIEHNDADDAAQNTFIKIWDNLESFRGDCALFSWIYRIATNEALSILRKKRPRLSLDEEAHELEKIIESGMYIGAEQIERQLQKAIIRLPEKQRLVFGLKYFEELSYDQISEITGTSIGALKASYFHAVRKIEEFVRTWD